MFVKILSGDLIALDTKSLADARQQLSDQLLLPRRHLKLIDPDTGEEAVETEDATRPKEMLYLLVSNSPSEVTKLIDSWWEYEYSGGVYDLFEKIGSSFRPKHSPEEFEELVKDKSYRFLEMSHRSNMGVRRTLLGFMISRLSPVFLIDYLPRLQQSHYDEEPNVVYKILCSCRMNLIKIEDYSEEEAEEELYYLFDRIKAFRLSVARDSILKAEELNYKRVLEKLKEFSL